MAARVFDKDDEIISDINIIPLVDISLVLLIIFMVTSNYVMTGYIKVDVPKARYAKAAQFREALSIAISGEGIIYLDDKPVTLKELNTKLALYCREHKDPEVILNADKAVGFKSVVAVIDVLSDLNISRINIATVED